MLKLNPYKCALLSLCFFLMNCGSDEPEEPIIINREPYVGVSSFLVEQTIDNQTVLREVTVHAPEPLQEGRRYPIVMALHGQGSKGNSWVNILGKFVLDGEFIGIYPQGHLDSWNVGLEPSSADDIDYLSFIMQEVSVIPNVDFGSKYGIGFANGSGMISKIAVQRNFFDAIATLSSQLIVGQEPLGSTSPVSVFQINGVEDTLIPVDGGLDTLGHNYYSAKESAELWASAFFCDDPVVTELGLDNLVSFSGCEDSKEVQYLLLENEGHVLGTDKSLVLFDEIWAFFQRF